MGSNSTPCPIPNPSPNPIPNPRPNPTTEAVAYARSIAGFVARRAIPAGAEITIDYNVNISGGTSWPCRCGASRCTGTVVGDFFLLPAARQLEYLPLLAEWFIRRHRERLGGLLTGESPRQS